MASTDWSGMSARTLQPSLLPVTRRPRRSPWSLAPAAPVLTALPGAGQVSLVWTENASYNQRKG